MTGLPEMDKKVDRVPTNRVIISGMSDNYGGQFVLPLEVGLTLLKCLEHAEHYECVDKYGEATKHFIGIPFNGRTSFATVKLTIMTGEDYAMGKIAGPKPVEKEE